MSSSIDISDKRLVLVLGKGGVGRSTIAAALAGQNAARGKKTLLFETNANDRFGTYFDKPAVGPDVTELGPNLSAVNTNPAAALEEYGLMILKFKSVYEMVFENKITKAFLRAIPGLDDYSLVGKAWFHTEETKRGRNVWDTIVFDMPASGHSVSMLADSVGDHRDGARWSAHAGCAHDQAAVHGSEADRGDHRHACEEMPVNEAIELEQKLTAIGIVPQHVICNQVYPEHFAPGSPIASVLEALIGTPNLPSPLAELVTQAQLSRDRHALNTRYLAELKARAKAPVHELPIIFTPQLSPAQVKALGEKI